MLGQPGVRNRAPSLEELAFYYGTDKARDDHKYTDLYAALFDPIRSSARNITEIGIASGQSLQVWHDYFGNAHVWGMDIVAYKIKDARKLFAEAPRVTILQANSKSTRAMSSAGFVNNSMDVIIDDGDHAPQAMEQTLQVMWPYLRAGGYYVVEDVATGANRGSRLNYGSRYRYPAGFSPLVHNASFLSEATRQLLRQHDVFFVDTLPGHRAPEKLMEVLGLWMKDLVNHDSHVLVIRKRETPRTRSLHMLHAAKLAMKKRGVRPLRDWRQDALAG